VTNFLPELESRILDLFALERPPEASLCLFLLFSEGEDLASEDTSAIIHITKIIQYTIQFHTVVIKKFRFSSRITAVQRLNRGHMESVFLRYRDHSTAYRLHGRAQCPLKLWYYNKEKSFCIGYQSMIA